MSTLSSHNFILESDNDKKKRNLKRTTGPMGGNPGSSNLNVWNKGGK
jgi:hypothetical protein